MTVSTESALGRIVLMFGHVAGMLDLVILPLWVGGMMATHELQPQEAGGIVTLFLVGVLVSNGFLARRFGRLPNRAIVVGGYAVASLAFLALAQVPVGGAGSAMAQLLVLHAIGGLGVGAGLSCVHGTIARSDNPHRTFAIANLGVGIFAVIFFAATPPFMAAIGVSAVFYAVLFLTTCATIMAALAFPTPPALAAAGAGPRLLGGSAPKAIAAALTLGFIGVVLLQTAQAATTSFAERVGDFRGFAAAAIGTMFAVNGFVSLSAPALAGFLEKRLPAISVAIAIMIVHGLCSLVLTQTADFTVFSLAFMVMIFATIFGHTFIFGLFARLDPTGRMNASTPSMLMLGTAIGPVLGGTMVQQFGFPAMGMTSALIAWGGAACFAVIAWRNSQSPLLAPASA